MVLSITFTTFRRPFHVTSPAAQIGVCPLKVLFFTLSCCSHIATPSLRVVHSAAATFPSPFPPFPPFPGVCNRCRQQWLQ